MTFLDDLKETTSVTSTENGAVTYTTSLNANLDFFAMAGSMRDRMPEEVEALFAKAYDEDRMLALRNLVNLRDIRHGGYGERDAFRHAVRYVLKAGDYPAAVMLVDNLKTFGRWDDVFFLIENSSLIGGTSGRNFFDYGVTAIFEQLVEDTKAQRNGEKYSLLAKWLPNVNTKNKERRDFANKLCSMVFGTTSADRRAYRKMIVGLRSGLDLVETDLASKDYDNIDFSKLPSKALFQYRQAFYRHLPERYSDFLDKVQSGEATMNAGLVMPHEIVKAYHAGGWGAEVSRTVKPELEATWKSLDDVITVEENAIVVADTSASMWGTPWEVAEGLAIYTAERLEGAFKNHFITFSRKPSLVQLPEHGTLRDKMEEYERHSIVSNTDIKAVFNLILDTAVKNDTPQSELPSKIIIVSDMEFDRMTDNADKTVFQAAKKEFADKGYNLPDIVFWNVDARNDNIPVRHNEQGAALVSGFSTNVLRMVLGKELSPVKIMLEVLGKEEYDFVEEASKEAFERELAELLSL